MSIILTEKAFLFAQTKHIGQERKHTGEAYITHPTAVSKMVSNFTNNNDLIIAALLHDTIEDTNTTFDEISTKFGRTIAMLVLELTIDIKIKRKIGKRQYMVNTVNVMSSDAFLIKLCDRYHNISDLDSYGVPLGFTKWYCRETKYLIEHLDRSINKQQMVLINMISSFLDYLKITRNFYYETTVQ